jgi:hypothetical protein
VSTALTPVSWDDPPAGAALLNTMKDEIVPSPTAAELQHK